MIRSFCKVGVQSESIDSTLRDSLWNVLDEKIYSSDEFFFRSGLAPHCESFYRHVWARFFKLPMDTIPTRRRDSGLKYIREWYFAAEWYEVYNFIEWCVQRSRSRWLQDAINDVLGCELSAYRLVDYTLTDITTPEEIEMLEGALSDDEYPNVKEHLRTAFARYSDREKPDYRNSIKESISAVEALACIIAGKPEATLGEALKHLRKSGQFHTPLILGFEKIYGWTNGPDGIRHSMMDEPDLISDDAKFFLLSCTSFINYLKSHMSRD